MFFIKRLRPLLAYVYRLSWPSLIAATVLLFAITWVGLLILEPADSPIIRADTFWWFFFVTGTTVGYGDFAPMSQGGRLITVIFNMAGGIGLLGAFIGKLAGDFSTIIRRRHLGKGSYLFMSGHIVIFGWRKERTHKIVDSILADEAEDRQIILCSSTVLENPMPEKVSFVSGSQLAADDILQRSNTKEASCVIIDGGNDDQTLAIGIGVNALLNGHTHVVAYFQAEEYAKLLRNVNPRIETIVDMSGDLLVRAMQDPGSSQLHEELLSALVGSATQFSVQVPDSVSTMSYLDMLMGLKRHHDATLLAVAPSNSPGRLHLNANDDINPKDSLFIVAKRRLSQTDIDWAKFGS